MAWRATLRDVRGRRALAYLVDTAPLWLAIMLVGPLTFIWSDHLEFCDPSGSLSNLKLEIPLNILALRAA